MLPAKCHYLGPAIFALFTATPLPIKGAAYPTLRDIESKLEEKHILPVTLANLQRQIAEADGYVENLGEALDLVRVQLEPAPRRIASNVVSLRWGLPVHLRQVAEMSGRA